MKKYKKTYAILHLTEKHTVFYLGKTKVHVSFTGGIVTKKGVTPATFTTDDPIVQLAIENSADFKKGAITIRSQYRTQGEVIIGKNPPEENPAPSKAEILRNAAPPAPEAAAPVKAEENPELATDAPADTSEKEEPTDDAIIEAAATEPLPKQAEGEEGKLEVVEVSCRDVAKQYLQEHFDENPTPLRTIANIQECAAKYGITFNFV